MEIYFLKYKHVHFYICNYIISRKLLEKLQQQEEVLHINNGSPSKKYLYSILFLSYLLLEFFYYFYFYY